MIEAPALPLNLSPPQRRFKRAAAVTLMRRKRRIGRG